MKNKHSAVFTTRRTLVNGQSIHPWSRDKLGLSDFSRAGCCPIATYNAMVLLDRDMSLGEVADQYVGGPCGSLLHGLWGSAPWNTARFLRRHLGRSAYRGFLRVKALDAAAREGDVAIFFMMNHRYKLTAAFHCMAARFENGGWTVYNVSNRVNRSVRFPALRQKTREGHFLYGFLIRPNN